MIRLKNSPASNNMSKKIRHFKLCLRIIILSDAFMSPREELAGFLLLFVITREASLIYWFPVTSHETSQLKFTSTGITVK